MIWVNVDVSQIDFYLIFTVIIFSSRFVQANGSNPATCNNKL